MAKSNAGRPRAVTEVVIHKLEHAFSMSFTDSEACLFAGIGMSTLYDYCKANPKFSDKKEMLKGMVGMKAKQNLKDAIEDGDEDISKWWLERKNKAEFSLKQEIDHRSEDGSMSPIDPVKGLQDMYSIINGSDGGKA